MYIVLYMNKTETKKKVGRPPKEERNKAVLSLLRTGMKQKDVAKQFNITPRRVRYIMQSNKEE